MSASRAMCILAALFFITPLAHADGTTTMQFTRVTGASNGVYYVYGDDELRDLQCAVRNLVLR